MASQAATSSSPQQNTNERKRVKVYELRENDWFDRGTGFCAVQTINEDGRIFVEAEDDASRSLLEVTIKKDDSFQKQQDTLIVWTDSEGIDMALSFQEAEGCGVVWTAVGDVQSKLPDGPDDAFMQPMILPAAELANLPDIDSVIRGAGNTAQGRDTLCKMIIADNYIAALTPLVEMAEDFESLSDLHRLCTIMKTLILFNETNLIEYLVRDDIILGVVGALEYDPDFPSHKANHRQYLSDDSKFKEVVRIEDEEIRTKIHNTYRLQYLKDVVLARILDDPTFSVLNSLIYFNQIEIVAHITNNMTFLKELFSLISSPDAPTERKKDAVLFIQQSCGIAKALPAPQKSSLYSNLIACGLFTTITFALQHHQASVRVAGTEILVAMIEHDQIMVRSYIYKSVSDKTKPLTDTLIELLLIEEDIGVKAQMADAIKVLLEPANGGPTGPGAPAGQDRSPNNENGLFMSKSRNHAMNASQSDNFLQNFFESSAKKLFMPLKLLEHRKSLDNLKLHDVELYAHLVDILGFFLRQHSYRSKYFILSEGLASRVAQLLACPQKHLKLTAIKYFRTLLSTPDDFHTRQLIQHNLLSPLLLIVEQTLPRNNLLNSAALDFFDAIRRDAPSPHIRPLILHLVDAYRSRLEAITYVSVFAGILDRYDQLLHPPSSIMVPHTSGADTESFVTTDGDIGSMAAQQRHANGVTGPPQHPGRWAGGLRDDEDAYFNGSDDEEDNENENEHENDEDDDVDELSKEHAYPHLRRQKAKNLPLVDYADDEDEDDDAIDRNCDRLVAAMRRKHGEDDEDLPSYNYPEDRDDEAQVAFGAAPGSPSSTTATITSPPALTPTSSGESVTGASGKETTPEALKEVFAKERESLREKDKKERKGTVMTTAEKRRREEMDADDADADELSSAQSVKRRNSGASFASATSSVSSVGATSLGKLAITPSTSATADSIRQEGAQSEDVEMGEVRPVSSVESSWQLATRDDGSAAAAAAAAAASEDDDAGNAATRQNRPSAEIIKAIMIAARRDGLKSPNADVPVTTSKNDDANPQRVKSSLPTINGSSGDSEHEDAGVASGGDGSGSGGGAKSASAATKADADAGAGIGSGAGTGGRLSTLRKRGTDGTASTTPITTTATKDHEASTAAADLPATVTTATTPLAKKKDKVKSSKT